MFSAKSFGKLTAIAPEGSFMPETGTYLLSGWVKEMHTTQQVSYTKSNIKVSILGCSVQQTVITSTIEKTLKPIGKIIDGWQKIEGLIEIPAIDPLATNPRIVIELVCGNLETETCYFDDIRFYPINGNMKSFVYDEVTQKLMAELDENNYATFYEYDPEGGLIRIKKETEKGVFTIQETRSSTKKQ